jgi:hypothetical protein
MASRKDLLAQREAILDDRGQTGSQSRHVRLPLLVAGISAG